MKKQILKKRRKQPEQPPTRITNDTVAEHRERILAGGRRFKYPVQYTRHKLVINAIIVGVVALILLIGVVWWQLYPAQNTGTFFYRFTKVLPLPVASVDGASVRYSDYLVRYRGSMHWLERNGQLEQSKESAKHQEEFNKRSVLNSVEEEAYAAKLARERGITVSDDELNQAVQAGLQASNGTISQDLYNSSIFESFGYTPDEYRSILRQSLLRQKVAYAIDDDARSLTDRAEKLLAKKRATLQSAAKELGKAVQYGESGTVSKTNQDGGLALAASSFEVGQVSEPIKSTTGDGYYIIKLESRSGSKLNYSYIKVSLTTFDKQFAALRTNNKINEYIDVPLLGEGR